ncbi:MAG: hypothetical protein K2X03_15040 [Bryobacteraceae bacterium]|nr:hypothetical protein [Bryobacteraceae bacterium]
MFTAFLLFRYLTGLMLSVGLALLLLITLFHSAVNFAREGAGVLGYVVALFSSGFTKGTRPPDPRGWITSMPQVGLALLFLAMIVSLFYPSLKALLHTVAAMGLVALAWYARMMGTEWHLEILCLPLIPLWFLYYGLCLFWFRPVATAGASLTANP